MYVVEHKQQPGVTEEDGILNPFGCNTNTEDNHVIFNFEVCSFHSQFFTFSTIAKILKKGYDPDAITFSTLIKGLCLKGDLHKALHFHDKVVALGFHLHQFSYGTLINGLCKVGQTRAALQLLNELMGDKGLFDEALALLSKMEDNGCIPNAKTYELVILSLFEKDENDMAEKLLCEMIARGLL